MIVQTAPEGSPHFVIAMHQHTAFAGSLSAHFGNDRFAGLEPEEPMQFVVSNHDAGWVELDGQAPQSPETGLPYHLTATPLADIVATSAGSPALNEAHHPFSGIISSMHTYGLYHGRYGLSDKLFLDVIPDDMRPDVDAMLDAEVDRQTRLKEQLRSDESTAAQADDDLLFFAYKQLQFFDTFSLYLHMTHEGARGESEFLHVPVSLDEDITISVTEHEGGVYALDPYPFDRNGLDLFTMGHYLLPQPQGTDLVAALAATPVERQNVRLVAA